MAINVTNARKLLKNSDVGSLFIEELGWDKHGGATVNITVDGNAFALSPVAQKRGVQVFECPPASDGAIPDRPTRQRIERQLRKSAHEHLLIFVNGDRSEQLWQWVAREPGRPAALREQRYSTSQHADALIHKLDRIEIPISEEESISVTLVTQKLKDAFDKDKVTKKFYERFKAEHTAFLKEIKGIKDEGSREWYASLMLNRLMFVYFIQKKGFLDGDSDYLRNRLVRLQKKRKDKFHTFYRHFLLRLFHEGLGSQPPRGGELDELLGVVPYLNGGLFDVHELEETNKSIQIPDSAFEALFAFFDAYDWHLDQRPLRANNEINPDVLGYIFEKYVNQKQMGAYYTKEDITGYISQNTIIPFLFDAAKKDCEIAFIPDGAVWRLLREDPDRYIYAAVRRGVDEPLPDDIAAGVGDVSKRTNWNKPAAQEVALPTETWREHVARRNRCHELRSKLRAGEVMAINELITLNLDIRQFAQDVIEESEGPELVRAFFKAIERITVLDPAVGSGAFLFAALNVLKPLYDAALDRMQAFIDDDDPKHYTDFRETLANVAKHGNREYFVLKSIVINNLYGVDIMEEAVEICKLRLFLKLVAQLLRPEEIEPLPDMDFNIRAGNTLVGFESLDSVRAAMTQTIEGQGKLLTPDDREELRRIERDATIIDEQFQKFHRDQVGSQVSGKALAKIKANVRQSLSELRSSLDELLAGQYGADSHVDKYEAWRASHSPFHWLVEFFGIVRSGGFDVIIGNPPYLESNKLNGAYAVRSLATAQCRDIYAWMLERAATLLSNQSRLGMIVPVSLPSSDSFKALRDALSDSLHTIWLSHFANRPGQLFEGAQNRLTILLGSSLKSPKQRFSTRYHRWDARRGERAALFGLLEYTSLSVVLQRSHGLLPKVGSQAAALVLAKILAMSPVATMLAKTSEFPVFWVRVPGYFCQFYLTQPFVYPDDGGQPRPRGELLKVFAATKEKQEVLYAVLNSSTYVQFFYALTDGRHINPSEVRAFPFSPEKVSTPAIARLGSLSRDLAKSMDAAMTHRRKSGLRIESVDSRKTKPLLDEIDTALASHYAFTPEELDFIINYDIKYRMGADGDHDED